MSTLPVDIPAQPTVAVIGGTGELGQGLSVRLAHAGVPLIVASRRPLAGAEAAAEIIEMIPQARVEALDYVSAVQKADIVFLCVPFAHQVATMAVIAPHLRDGQIVVDCVVPLAAAVGGKATRILGVWQGSAAEQAQELAPPGVSVVSALHTISGVGLANLRHEFDEDVLVCGDRKADKERVIALLDRIDGLRPVDCGRLEQSRIVESLTALLIQINIRHKAHAGIRITGLHELVKPDPDGGRQLELERAA